MSSFIQDLRIAARGLARSPRQAVIVVASLTLGVGANAAMFSVVDRLFFRTPPGIADPSGVVRLYVTRHEPPFAPTAAVVADYPRFIDLSTGVHGLAHQAAFATVRLDVGRGSEASQLTAQIITPSYFTLLGTTPALGRFFTAQDDLERRPVAVLSFEFWQRRFGADTAVIGRSLLLGTSQYAILGVAPPRFNGVDWRSVDLWLPISVAAAQYGHPLDCRDCRWLETIGRLRQGVTEPQASEEATAAFRHSSIDSRDTAAVVTLGPIQSARGPLTSTDAKLSLQLAAVTLLVFVIMCANLANLTLARTMKRQREMAIRRALGATPWLIAKQLLAEGALVGALGGLGAILTAAWSGSLLSVFLLRGLDGAIDMDRRLLTVTAVMVMMAVLVSNIVPAVLVSRRDLATTIAGVEHVGAGGSALARACLVATQVALTLVLLVGARLFLSSLRKVTAIPLGFDPDHVVHASVDFRQGGYPNAEINLLYARMRARVQQLPGVASASVAIGSPFATSIAIAFAVPGAEDSLFHSPAGGPYYQAISSDYFATLGTRLRRGRPFVPDDRIGSARVAIVNETMSRRFWPIEGAIGRCLKIGTGTHIQCSEIVGVVDDVRRNEVVEQPTMQYYSPLAQTDSSMFLPITALLVRTVGPAAAAVDALRSTIQSTSADLPYANVTPISELYEWQLRPWRLGSTVLGMFAVLGLALAAVGLYGVLSYFVVNRTKEIGLRVALGASRTSVLLLVIRQGASTTLAGLVVGSVATRLVARYWAATVYGVSPTDPWTVAEAALLLMVVACAACYGPARRATCIDPVVALRAD